MSFGGYDRWRLWHLEVVILGFKDVPKDSCFLEVLIVGCFNFGGYELWRLWSWGLWTFPKTPVLEVLIIGCFSFGGYELWRLWSWGLWTFPKTPVFGGFDRWMFQFWRLWTLEVMVLEFLICGFGCCVNWMLRSWMLQYSPSRNNTRANPYNRFWQQLKEIMYWRHRSFVWVAKRAYTPPLSPGAVARMVAALHG